MGLREGNDNIVRELTPKQAAFVDEYLIDLNATQAAARAGYSAKTAASQGERLLRNVEIQRRVSEAQQDRSERTEITADWVLGRLKENADRAMQAEPVLDKLGHETGEWTYQGNVANRALELLGKHVGLFSDKLEHSGPAGAPIAIAVTRRVVHVHAE